SAVHSLRHCVRFYRRCRGVVAATRVDIRGGADKRAPVSRHWIDLQSVATLAASAAVLLATLAGAPLGSDVPTDRRVNEAQLPKLDPPGESATAYLHTFQH